MTCLPVFLSPNRPLNRTVSKLCPFSPYQQSNDVTVTPRPGAVPTRSNAVTVTPRPGAVKTRAAKKAELPHSATEQPLNRLIQEMSTVGSPAFDGEIAAGENFPANIPEVGSPVDRHAMELLARAEQNNRDLLQHQDIMPRPGAPNTRAAKDAVYPHSATEQPLN